MLPKSFASLSLENRLGQNVEIAVNCVKDFRREIIFVTALTQQASSLVAKNAEHFAHQLRDVYDLDTRRFEMIELRGDMVAPTLWRWRFEWVGTSPFSARCELITSPSQHMQLCSLLGFGENPQAVAI